MRSAMSLPLAAAAFAAAAFFPACSFFEDITHMESLSVTAVSPSETFVLPENVREASVAFSAEMRRALTEDSFSLKADSSSVLGTFSWRDGGRILAFKPLAPLEAKRSYTLSISTSAEDRRGNSLEEAFVKTFHTRSETETPFLVSHSPAPGASAALREPVVLVFSEAMDAASVLVAFSLTPRPEGFFTWNSAGTELCFTPLEDWAEGEAYDVSTGSGCRDREGNLLAEERSFRFFGPASTEAEVLSVTALKGGFGLEPAGPGSFVDASLETEKDESFRVAFSSAPKPERRRGLLSVNPSVPFALAWEADGRACVLSFSENLAWGIVYELKAAGSAYRFVVNGPGSVPLGIGRIVYVRDTTAGSPEYEELLLAGNYDFPDSASAAFDVYVRRGPGAVVELASFLEAFSVTASNGCVDIETLRVETPPSSPAPVPAPAADETVFRVLCSVDDVLASGVVTITVGRALRDGRGNGLAADFVLPVNKQ